MPGYMTVELKNLRFFGTHGMYAEEEKIGNEFIVDVSVSFATPEAPITSIDETVNYVAVYNMVAAELKERRQLLETCAMRICNSLQQVFSQISTATVSIKKAAPPITGFTGSVGVSYTKNF